MQSINNKQNVTEIILQTAKLEENCQFT